MTLGALLQLLPATELAPEGQCKATLSGTAMQLQRSLIGLETWARHLISLGEACTSSRFETGRQLEKRLVRHIATVITVAIESVVAKLTLSRCDINHHARGSTKERALVVLCVRACAARVRGACCVLRRATRAVRWRICSGRARRWRPQGDARTRVACRVRVVFACTLPASMC